MLWVLLVLAIPLGFVLASWQMTFNRQVRCPSCTQRQWAPRKPVDYNCNRCGAPILRSGEFVQATNSSQ